MNKPHQPQLVFLWVLCLGGIGIWRCQLMRREENRRAWRKTLGAKREPTTNSTLTRHQVEIEPGATLMGGERFHFSILALLLKQGNSSHNIIIIQKKNMTPMMNIYLPHVNIPLFEKTLCTNEIIVMNAIHRVLLAMLSSKIKLNRQ